MRSIFFTVGLAVAGLAPAAHAASWPLTGSMI